jgi:hypothetical protein
METVDEITLKTRQHFADSALKCIEDAKNGITRVNDLQAYIEWRMDMYKKCLSGAYDSTLTHLQYAHYLKTGVCIPLLP